MDIQNEWAKWADVHDTEDQQKRIASSRAAACTPLSVDIENASACFQGRRGKYNTFLDRCNCGDFIRRQAPCKHIYRLAHELGLLSGNVAAYQHGGYGWKQVVEIIEKHGEDVQTVFFDCFCRACKKSEPFRIMKKPALDTLIEAGVLIAYPEKETPKYYTVSMVEDYMVNRQKVRYYFSRKFNPPSFFNGVEMQREELPEDDVTAFLRERGFVE